MKKYFEPTVYRPVTNVSILLKSSPVQWRSNRFLHIFLLCVKAKCYLHPYFSKNFYINKDKIQFFSSLDLPNIFQELTSVSFFWMTLFGQLLRPDFALLHQNASLISIQHQRPQERRLNKALCVLQAYFRLSHS